MYRNGRGDMPGDESPRQSPWSTPSKSEYHFGDGLIEARGAFSDYEKDEMFGIERELPDGHPSPDDPFEVSFANSSISEDSRDGKSKSPWAKPVSKMPKSPKKATIRSKSPSKTLFPRKNGTKIPFKAPASPSKRVGGTRRRKLSFETKHGGAPLTEPINDAQIANKSPGKVIDGSGSVLRDPLSSSTSPSLVSAHIATTPPSSPVKCSLGLSPNGGTSPNQVPGSKAEESPRKSVRKSRKKVRDIIKLVQPFESIRSDDVRRWEAQIRISSTMGPEGDDELAASMAFTNALVLKLNQIAKQGLLARPVVFRVGLYISKFTISEAEWKKSMNSFFTFARQLTLVREGLKEQEQKELFDVEERVPRRPATAKPKDPDYYDFKDENLAKDYRKLWEEYQSLQASAAAP